MKVVSCRKCDTSFKIRPASFQENKYEEGICCLKCWGKPKNTIKVSSPTTSLSLVKSSSKKSFADVAGENNMLRPTKFDVGDEAWLKTDKHGVIKGMVIDLEDFRGDQNNPDYIFYAVDIKGEAFDYIPEPDLFISRYGAEATETTVKLTCE